MASLKEIQLIALGKMTPAGIQEFHTPIQTMLGVEPLISKTILEPPDYAFNKDRNQYNVGAILKRLGQYKDPSAMSILGIADFDIFLPDTPYVLGEADRESKVGICSFFRLRGDTPAQKRRTQLEVVHEAAHLIGLSYCEDVRCLMYLAQSVQDVERRAHNLCNNCRNELAKIKKRHEMGLY